MRNTHGLRRIRYIFLVDRQSLLALVVKEAEEDLNAK